jgi:hypothetical protein
MIYTMPLARCDGIVDVMIAVLGEETLVGVPPAPPSRTPARGATPQSIVIT